MKTDTKHRGAIDHRVLGSERVDRYILSWDETHPGGKMHCSMPVATRLVAKWIIEDLLLLDDDVTKINLVPIS